MSEKLRELQQCAAKLDELTAHMKMLFEDANEDRLADRMCEIRTEMGFEGGGYVGHITIDEMLEEFEQRDKDEDDEEE